MACTPRGYVRRVRSTRAIGTGADLSSGTTRLRPTSDNAAQPSGSISRTAGNLSTWTTGRGRLSSVCVPMVRPVQLRFECRFVGDPHRLRQPVVRGAVHPAHVHVHAVIVGELLGHFLPHRLHLFTVLAASHAKHDHPRPTRQLRVPVGRVQRRDVAEGKGEKGQRHRCVPRARGSWAEFGEGDQQRIRGSSDSLGS